MLTQDDDSQPGQDVAYFTPDEYEAICSLRLRYLETHPVAPPDDAMTGAQFHLYTAFVFATGMLTGMALVALIVMLTAGR